MNTNGPQDSSAPTPPREGLSGAVRAWRYFLVVLALAVLVAAFYGEEDWRGRSTWEQYQHELAARGRPVEAAQIIPATVPDADNFAMTPFLAPLFDFFPGSRKWRNPTAYERAQQFPTEFTAAEQRVPTLRGAGSRSNTWVGPLPSLQAWFGGFLARTNRPGDDSPIELGGVTREDAAREILKALADSDRELTELRAASRRPYALQSWVR